MRLRWIARFAVAVTVAATFSPVAIVPFAFTDDYPVLQMTNGLGESPWFGESIVKTATAGGRPFAGLMIEAAYQAAGSIENLRFVRLTAVAGIVGLGLLLLGALVRAGLRTYVAALIAIFMCTLPAFQVYGSWGVLFYAPFAAIVGSCASLLVTAAVTEWEVNGKRIAGGTAVLVVALLAYQPAAMFFWVFLAVALVGHAADARRAGRVVIAHAAAAALALTVAFFALKLGVHWFGGSAPNASRSRLVRDVPDKLDWFVRQPLRNSLNLFDLTPTTGLAVLVAAISITGIGLQLLRRTERPVLMAAVGAALIPVTYLPNLVIAEEWATYRSQVALSSLLALYASLGVIGVWCAACGSVRGWATPAHFRAVERAGLLAATAAVAVSATAAARNIVTLFADPQITELRMIRSQIEAMPSGATSIGFIHTGFQSGMSDVIRYDEFGLASSMQPWTLEPAVLLVLREQKRLGPIGSRPKVEMLPWDTVKLPGRIPVVDVRGLKDRR